jgi:hypothetical protein
MRWTDVIAVVHTPLALRTVTWLVLVVAMIGPRAAAIDPKAKWIRVKTDQVEILSDARQKDAVEFAVQYSAFRYVLAEMIGPAAQKLPASTVMLFNDTRQFQRYFSTPKASLEKVSISTEVDDAALVGQSLGGNRELSLQMAFEFETTWGLRRMGYFLPVWAAQGTGKVFSTIALKKGVCIVGQFEGSALDAWLNEPVAWPRFFDVSTDSPEYTQARVMGFYHSQAWALMHRIWLGDANGRERFNQLPEKVRAIGGLAAVESVLGVTAKQLTRELTLYARGASHTREFRFNEAGLRARMEVGPAELPVVAVQLSNLLYSAGKELEADRELNEAWSLAADMPFVKEALARRELRRRNLDAAVALYREAITQGSLNPRAYLISAAEWMKVTSGRTDQAGGGGIFADKAIADLRRALQLNPGNMEAYRMLGRAFFLRPEVSAEHVEELSAGVGPGDESGHVRYYRSLLLGRLKRNADFQNDLEALLQSPQTATWIRAEVEQRVNQAAFNVALERAQNLVASAKFAEAHEWVISQQQTAAGRALAAHYEKLLQWVEQSEQRSKSKR